MTAPAATALAALADTGLSGWPGLPEGRSPEDFAPVIDAPADAQALADVGMRKGLARFGELAPFAAPAQLFTSTDGAEVWVVAIDDPPFAGAPQLERERLGSPALALDSARGTVSLPGAEWVYPQRGLTVFADVVDARIWRVALFPRCTEEQYVELYRLGAGEHRPP